MQIIYSLLTHKVSVLMHKLQPEVKFSPHAYINNRQFWWHIQQQFSTKFRDQPSGHEHKPTRCNALDAIQWISLSRHVKPCERLSHTKGTKHGDSMHGKPVAQREVMGERCLWARQQPSSSPTAGKPQHPLGWTRKPALQQHRRHTQVHPGCSARTDTAATGRPAHRASHTTPNWANFSCSGVWGYQGRDLCK